MDYLPLGCFGKAPCDLEYLEHNVRFTSSKRLKSWIREGFKTARLSEDGRGKNDYRESGTQAFLHSPQARPQYPMHAEFHSGIGPSPSCAHNGPGKPLVGGPAPTPCSTASQDFTTICSLCIGSPRPDAERCCVPMARPTRAAPAGRYGSLSPSAPVYHIPVLYGYSVCRCYD